MNGIPSLGILTRRTLRITIVDTLPCARINFIIVIVSDRYEQTLGNHHQVHSATPVHLDEFFHMSIIAAK